MHIYDVLRCFAMKKYASAGLLCAALAEAHFKQTINTLNKQIKVLYATSRKSKI